MKPMIHFETEGLIGQFQDRYGVTEGGERYRRVIPGILADFQKMALGLKPGEKTQEDYIMEDRTSAVRMTAEKTTGGEVLIRAALQGPQLWP